MTRGLLTACLLLAASACGDESFGDPCPSYCARVEMAKCGNYRTDECEESCAFAREMAAESGCGEEFAQLRGCETILEHSCPDPFTVQVKQYAVCMDEAEDFSACTGDIAE